MVCCKKHYRKEQFIMSRKATQTEPAAERDPNICLLYTSQPPLAISRAVSLLTAVYFLSVDFFTPRYFRFILFVYVISPASVSYTHLDVYKRTAQECIESAFQNCYQSLPAGIHHSGLFQYRQHLRGSLQHSVGLCDYILKKYLQILTCLLYTSRCV